MAFLSSWGPVSLTLHQPNNQGSLNRNLVDSTQLIASGSVIQLQLYGRSADYKIVDCYIGHQGTTGTAWDFDGNQTRVTFGSGGTGCTVPANTNVTSDPITFSLDKSRSVLISYFGTNSTFSDWPYANSLPGCTNYYVAGYYSNGTVGSSHIPAMTAISGLGMIFIELDVQQGNGVIATLPMITITCVSGNFLAQPANVPFYPVLTCIGESPAYAELNGTSGAISLAANGGHYVDDDVPFVSLNFQAHVNPWARVNDTLYDFLITATGHMEGLAEIVDILPAIYITCSGHDNQIAEIIRTLPIPQLSANVLYGMLAEINMTPYPITLDADAYWTKGITLNATLPAIISNYIKAAGVITMVALNTKNLAVTQYDNYPFNSMCWMNGIMVGAKSDGIYALTGTMDGTGIIPWRIRLEKFDLAIKDYKSQEFKHKMRYAWITGEINGDIVLTLEDYVGNRWNYIAETVTGAAHELKVKVGKGIKTRYISIELSPSDQGAAVVLDHINLFGTTTEKTR